MAKRLVFPVHAFDHRMRSRKLYKPNIDTKVAQV